MNYGQSKRPFVGLRSFESNENDIFFGRDKLIGKMLDKLAKHRFLAVTGISGGGKSSLVKTGLVNGLRMNLIQEAGELWTVIDMRPNNRPIYILAEALLNKIPNEKRFENDVEFLTSRFKRNPKSFIDFLYENRRFFEGSLLIIIDQFEEIFRYEDRDENNSVKDSEYNDIMVLVDLLIHSSNQRDLMIYNIITIRADYLGECALFHGLPELINKSQFIIPRLARNELHDAIALPVKMHGGEIEPVLVNRILNDLGHNLEQLPQMQHVLMRIWNSARKINKDNPKFTLELYEKNGGLEKSISNHAEEIYGALTIDEQELCKKIFKYITRVNSHGKNTRMQRFIEKISYAVDADIEEIEKLTQKFRKEDISFLRPNQKYVLKEDIMLDITHESIMRQWERLDSWIKEEARFKEHFLELKRASDYFHDGKGALLIEPDLSRMLDWREESKATERWANRYGNEFDAVMGFLNKSDNEEKERLRKEKLEKEKREEEIRKKKRRQRWIIVSVVSVVLVFLGYSMYTDAKLAKQELKIEKENNARKLAEQKLKTEKESKAKELAKKDAMLVKQELKLEQERRDKELAKKDAMLVKQELKLEQERRDKELAEKDAMLVKQELKLEHERRDKELAEKDVKLQKLETEKESRARRLAERDKRYILLERKLNKKTINKSEYREFMRLAKKTNDIEKARLLLMGLNQKLNDNGEKSLIKIKKLLDKHKNSLSVKELQQEYNYYTKIIDIKYDKAEKEDKPIILLVTMDDFLEDCNQWFNMLTADINIRYKINKYFKMVIFSKSDNPVPLEKTLEEEVRKFPTILIIDPVENKVIFITDSSEIKNVNEFEAFLDEVMAYSKSTVNNK